MCLRNKRIWIKLKYMPHVSFPNLIPFPLSQEWLLSWCFCYSYACFYTLIYCFECFKICMIHSTINRDMQIAFIAQCFWDFCWYIYLVYSFYLSIVFYCMNNIREYAISHFNYYKQCRIFLYMSLRECIGKFSKVIFILSSGTVGL